MIRVALVLILTALGLLGLILPLMPGVPFLIIALYLAGIIDRRRLLGYMKRFRGKKGSVWRKLIACFLIKVVYGRRLNLK